MADFAKRSEITISTMVSEHGRSSTIIASHHHDNDVCPRGLDEVESVKISVSSWPTVLVFGCCGLLSYQQTSEHAGEHA